MENTLTLTQKRVLVSLVEGAGTTQRFGRWKRGTVDALQRKGLLAIAKVTDGDDDIYPVWRIDLTDAGRRMRQLLGGTIEPIGFPFYAPQTRNETCLHNPRYPEGNWRCALKRGHSGFHRYKPTDKIEYL